MQETAISILQILSVFLLFSMWYLRCLQRRWRILKCSDTWRCVDPFRMGLLTPCSGCKRSKKSGLRQLRL